MAHTHNLLTLHGTALRHLRAGRFRAAMAPLCRLLLALEPGHEAERVVRDTLAHARRQLAPGPGARAGGL